MYKLACKDLDPSSDCDFVATGDTKDSVKYKMQKHTEKHHGEKMRMMSGEDIKQMTAKVEKILDMQNQ